MPIAYKIKTEKFSGPMDLLLQLIEQQKLEITEISLAQVTEQYLEHLEKMQELDAEELADFLVIAGRLLVLKTRALLPYLETEEEPDDLEKQLKMYKEFIEASKKIETMLAYGKFTYSREKPPTKTEIEFSPPPNLKINQFKEIMLVVLKRLDPLVKLPRHAIERTISLQQKIFEIHTLIKQNKSLGFKHLVKSAKTRTEVIVNFLAILELLKKQHIAVKQSNVFDDIYLEKV